MSSIKEAAKWMQEGKRVRRREWMEDDDTGGYLFQRADPYSNPLIVDEDDNEWALMTTDLLADDWEIAK